MPGNEAREDYGNPPTDSPVGIGWYQKGTDLTLDTVGFLLILFKLFSYKLAE